MYYEFQIFIVYFLLIWKSNATMQEETAYLKSAKSNRASYIKLKQAENIRFKAIATEKLIEYMESAYNNYPGIQTAIYVVQVPKFVDSNTPKDILHLIILFRNSENDFSDSKEITKDFEYFFLAMTCKKLFDEAQLRRVGSLQKSITLAATKFANYCKPNNRFQFQENLTWRKNEVDNSDCKIGKFMYQLVIGELQIILYMTLLSKYRFKVTWLQSDRPPLVKHLSHNYDSHAEVEDAIELYLSNPEGVSEEVTWIAANDLENSETEEFAYLLPQISSSLVNYPQDNYVLDKFFSQSGTNYFIVFVNGTEQDSNKRILVASRIGNILRKKLLVATDVKIIIDEEIDQHIKSCLSTKHPFCSEIHDREMTQLLDSAEHEVLARGAGRGVRSLEKVSCINTGSEVFEIYAREDSAGNLDGYFFAAFQLPIDKNELMVEFVQQNILKSEDLACAAISTYLKGRAPTLKFLERDTPECRALNAKSIHLEQELIESLKDGLTKKVELISAAYVEYNNIYGAIGIYLVNANGADTKSIFEKLNAPAKYAISPSSDKSFEISPSQLFRNIRLSPNVLNDLACSIVFAAFEVDEFSNRNWRLRHTSSIYKDVDVLKGYINMYLNGSFPFSSLWIEKSKLESSISNELDNQAKSLLKWRNGSEYFISNICTCHVLYYLNYIIMRYLCSLDGRVSGFFIVALQIYKYKTGQLVYLSPFLGEEELTFTLYQYMKQPFPYLEDWILALDTKLTISHLQNFNSTDFTLSPKSKKGKKEDNSDALSNFNIVKIRNVSLLHGSQKMAILESKCVPTCYKLVVWGETSAGTNIFQGHSEQELSALEPKIGKFLHNPVRSVLEVSDTSTKQSLYQVLTAKVDALLKWQWQLEISAASFLKAFILSDSKVYALYKWNRDKTFLILGVLATKVSSESSSSSTSSRPSLERTRSISTLLFRSASLRTIKITDLAKDTDNWRIQYITSSIATEEVEPASLALMPYYTNPQNLGFGDWVDFEDFNDASILEVIRDLDPILINYFCAIDSSMPKKEYSYHGLRPDKIKIRPQVDSLMMLYLITKRSKSREVVKEYFLVALVIRGFCFEPLTKSDYRINFISQPDSDTSKVKQKTDKYVAYQFAFNLTWEVLTGSDLEKSHTDVSEFLAGISKEFKIVGTHLSEIRTFAGEEVREYFIYKGVVGNSDERFTCAISRSGSAKEFIVPGSVCTKVELERIILNLQTSQIT